MAEDEGEPRRLRADHAGASLAGRLGQRLHLLSWRTPLHRMRLRGRYPLQLIDVPADPIPGSAAAGRALLEGRLAHAGQAVALDAIGKDPMAPVLAAHWQSFAWLRDLAAAAPRATGAPVAERLTRSWLAAHARAVDTGAWRADLWGRRILFWAAYAPFILDSRDADYRKELLNALARGARHLDRAADTAAQGLPRVTAWAGVVAAGLLIPGGDLRVAHGEAGIARALGQALHVDGGLVSRAPVEQLALIELLAQLRAVYEVRARPSSGAVARTLTQAVPVLADMVLGDGGLSSWQSGRPVAAARIQAAVAASGVRGGGVGEARDWGYQRLAQGQAVVVVDVAPPPAGALALGGCASTLAFELSDGGQRLVVNCGGAPGLPQELREGLRTTAAHSTLTLADLNSTALHDDGSMGKGVGEVAATRGPGRIEAGHDGYVKRLGFVHRRRLTLAEDGRALVGEDRLDPAGRRKPAPVTGYAIRFHLAPGLEVVPTADARGALIRPEKGAAWQLRAAEGRVAVEDSLWVDGAGRPRRTSQLVIAGEAPAAGVVVGWSLRRVS